MLFNHIVVKFMKLFLSLISFISMATYKGPKGRPQVIKSNGLVGTKSQKDLNDLVCPLHFVGD